MLSFPVPVLSKRNFGSRDSGSLSKRGSVLSGAGVQIGKAAMRRCSHVKPGWWNALQSSTKAPVGISEQSWWGHLPHHPHCYAPSHCLAVQLASVLPGEGVPHGGQLKGPFRGSCWIQEIQGGRNASSHCPKPQAAWWHEIHMWHRWKLMKGQVGRALRWHEGSLGFTPLGLGGSV